MYKGKANGLPPKLQPGLGKSWPKG